MKRIILFTFLASNLFTFSQDYKGAELFTSKIDSCFIDKVRFSTYRGFYIKTDSLEYLHSDESNYVHARNESYLLGEFFIIGNLNIEIKRINENYWYFSEKQDSSKLITGYFSIDKSEMEIPKGNYQFEIFPFPIDMEDSTRYFDTLYYIQKQGDWTEEYDEFYYSGNYKNNLKDSYWDLYNVKYHIPLSYDFYDQNSLINDSTFIVTNEVITSKNYFYGWWKIKNNWNEINPHLNFEKGRNNSGQLVYFEPKLYHYNNRCGVGQRPKDYNWQYNKKDMTIILDNQLYKIIYNSENKFILVKIENLK
jgi:hypothetical protein